MKITLNQEERTAMENKLAEYTAATGDDWNFKTAMRVLERIYQERFLADIDKVLERKVDNFRA